ncbi:MAG TPA: PAS domain S-box protein [Pyrinomonadaceae bacterium]|nr:PAS domain S-box protein [Pyrinomonadaceae bacterium]
MSEFQPLIEGNRFAGRVEENCAELRRLNEELRAELAGRVRDEEALRKKLAYLAESQRLSQTGSWVYDTLRGVSTYWSAEQYRICGFDPEEGPPSAEMDRAHHAPEEWSRLTETVKSAVRNNANFETDSWLEFPDGSTKYLRIIGHPVVNASGNVVELVGITIDVTERMRAEDTNRRLAWIVESTDDAIFSRTPEGIITSWNRGAEQMFGFRAEEIIGRHISTIIPDDLTDEIKDILDSARRGEARRLETVRLRKDGRRIDVALAISTIRDPHERIVGAAVIARDITERKRIEVRQARAARHAFLRSEVSAAFNESQGSLRTILQSCAEAVVRHLDAAFARIWTLDGDKNMLELQASAGLYTRLDGRHACIPVGSHKIGLVAAQRKSDLTNNVQEDERVSDKEWARREGMISFAGCPLTVEGHLVGGIAMFARRALERDTIEVLESIAPIIAQGIERKRAEEQLLLIKYTIDHVSDTAARIASDARFVFVNDACCNSLGYTREELLQLTVHDIDPNFPRDTWADHYNNLRARKSLTLESNHRRKDGHVFPIELSLTFLEYNGQEYSFAFGRDITERKRAEGELRRLQSELEHTARVMTMGALASSIAHEVNQPLAGIVTNGSACLRWLAMDPPDLEEARDAVNRIIRDGHRASDVIMRARALLKKAQPQKTSLNINEVVRETIAFAQHEVHKSEIFLRTKFSPELPMVAGDKIQLQQVLLNLLMNGIDAIKAAGDGRPQLSVETRPHEEDKILISVKDSGVGLGAGSLDKIFEAFYTTKREGMGMGLSISRSIVEAHGGRLWATPNDGSRGATFQFTLPVGEV